MGGGGALNRLVENGIHSKNDISKNKPEIKPSLACSVELDACGLEFVIRTVLIEHPNHLVTHGAR